MGQKLKTHWYQFDCVLEYWENNYRMTHGDVMKISNVPTIGINVEMVEGIRPPCPLRR